jgi:hypothetical protein
MGLGGGTTKQRSSLFPDIPAISEAGEYREDFRGEGGLDALRRENVDLRSIVRHKRFHGSRFSAGMSSQM